MRSTRQQATATTARFSHKSYRLTGTFGAITFVLVFLELLLRLACIGPLQNPNPKHFAPSPGACTSERPFRQYSEGFSLVHYCSDGARMTTRRFLENSPFGIILGDSFVEAAQVSDDATVGSLLEGMARSEEAPINVRQYGWSGAGPPVYVAISEQINRVFNPAWVTIVLNWDDLGTYGVAQSSYWRGHVNMDLSLSVSEAPESDASFPRPLAAAFRAFKSIRKRSFLLYLATAKLQSALQSTTAAANSLSTMEDQRANRAIVHALKLAYGDRLLLVYVPRVEVDSSEDPAAENDLFLACRDEFARCVSLREEMVRARDQNHQLCAGFSNTVPGEGHLNSHGHAVLAKVIWRTLHSGRG
jgi:hypothetical protein